MKNVFFRENKRWQQCQFVYSKANEDNITVDLATIMNALLRPDDIKEINRRVMQKRVLYYSISVHEPHFMN